MTAVLLAKRSADPQIFGRVYLTGARRVLGAARLGSGAHFGCFAGNLPQPKRCRF